MPIRTLFMRIFDISSDEFVRYRMYRTIKVYRRYIPLLKYISSRLKKEKKHNMEKCK